MEKDITIIFIHIPKCGGSTLRSIIDREYNNDDILYYEPDLKGFADTNYYLREIKNKRFKIITGHQPYGIHNNLRHRWSYFTFLRNPIDQWISNYYFAFDHKDHVQRELIVSGKLTLEEYLLDIGTNKMTCMLSNVPEANDISLDIAKNNLKNNFDFVGITEKFDQSILMLAKIYGWRPPVYLRKNVTKKYSVLKKGRKSLSKDYISAINEKFKYDLELYNYANKLFDERLKNQPSEFHNACDALKNIEQDLHSRTDVDEAKGYVLFSIKGSIERSVPDTINNVDNKDLKIIENYFKINDNNFKPAANIMGFIDYINQNSIKGWAADINDPSPINVNIFLNNELIQEITANTYREDLKSAGIHNGSHGFLFNFDKPLDINDNPVIEVKFSKTDTYLHGGYQRTGWIRLY